MPVVRLHEPRIYIPSSLIPKKDECYDEWNQRILSHSSREENLICRYCFKVNRAQVGIHSVPTMSSSHPEFFCVDCGENKYGSVVGLSFQGHLSLIFESRGKIPHDSN